jgi:hypothetical protein
VFSKGQGKQGQASDEGNGSRCSREMAIPEFDRKDQKCRLEGNMGNNSNLSGVRIKILTESQIGVGGLPILRTGEADR